MSRFVHWISQISTTFRDINRLSREWQLSLRQTLSRMVYPGQIVGFKAKLVLSQFGKFLKRKGKTGLSQIIKLYSLFEFIQFAIEWCVCVCHSKWFIDWKAKNRIFHWNHQSNWYDCVAKQERKKKFANLQGTFEWHFKFRQRNLDWKFRSSNHRDLWWKPVPSCDHHRAFWHIGHRAFRIARMPCIHPAPWHQCDRIRVDLHYRCGIADRDQIPCPNCCNRWIANESATIYRYAGSHTYCVNSTVALRDIAQRVLSALLVGTSDWSS